MIPGHRSIRWQILGSQVLLLIGVILGFGTLAFVLVRANQYARIDAELERRLGVVAFGVAPKRTASGFEVTFELRPEEGSLFGPETTHDYHYRVWLLPDDTEFLSDNAPSELEKPELSELSTASRIYQYGKRREAAKVLIRTGADSPRALLIVGCDVSSIASELARFRWLFSAGGLAILVLGTGTSWWISGRAIKPISTIGETARNIAEGEVSERIDVGHVENELGELAGVLNESFDRLQDAQARQAQFTADASHELRTPAFVILSQAQSALRKDRSTEEYRRAFEICEKAAKHIGDLVEGLLTLARRDSGEDTIHHEPCDLAAITEDAQMLLMTPAEKKGVTLETNLKPATVQGDKQALRQLVINLTNNAIQYTPEGGSIEVAVESHGEWVHLSVTDDGPGIAEADLPHIFDRFYRADKTRTAGSGNVGLGLSICQMIVDTHGGEIRAENRADGETGAIFRVELPAG